MWQMLLLFSSGNHFSILPYWSLHVAVGLCSCRCVHVPGIGIGSRERATYWDAKVTRSTHTAAIEPDQWIDHSSFRWLDPESRRYSHRFWKRIPPCRQIQGIRWLRGTEQNQLSMVILWRTSLLDHCDHHHWLWQCSSSNRWAMCLLQCIYDVCLWSYV